MEETFLRQARMMAAASPYAAPLLLVVFAASLRLQGAAAPHIALYAAMATAGLHFGLVFGPWLRARSTQHLTRAYYIVTPVALLLARLTLPHHGSWNFFMLALLQYLGAYAVIFCAFCLYYRGKLANAW